MKHVGGNYIELKVNRWQRLQGGPVVTRTTWHHKEADLRNIDVSFTRSHVSIFRLGLVLWLNDYRFPITIWHLIPACDCIEYSPSKRFKHCASFEQSLELN